MDSIAKDWKLLKEQLEKDIKEAQVRARKEKNKDRETLELMLKMLENSKIRVNREQQVE